MGNVSEDLQKKDDETQNTNKKLQEIKYVAVLGQQLHKAEKHSLRNIKRTMQNYSSGAK